MKQIYVDGQYFEKNPMWHEEEAHWKAHNIIKLIKKNNVNPQTICDIGCGSGGILNEMSKNLNNEIKFYGYEISPQAFKICKKKAKKNLSFTLGDLPDDQGLQFDIVMALDVFEHIEDYFGFLRNLKNRGTYKIFHIPLDYNVVGALSSKALLRARKEVGHIHYFTKETALATLGDTGYEILDYFYTNHPLDCPAKGWRTNLRKIPRALFYRYRPDIGARIFGDYHIAVLAK